MRDFGLYIDALKTGLLFWHGKEKEIVEIGKTLRRVRDHNVCLEGACPVRAQAVRLM